MDNFLKTAAGFETTLKLIETINRSTDDYLFLWDIQADARWFFGDIDRNYDIRSNGSETNSTSEMLRVIHPADRAAVLKSLDEIKRGVKDTHKMDYRWINRAGESVWINCHGNVIRDEQGNPAVMIGRVSEEALRHLFNPLTGLWNKVKLHEDMEERLNRSGTLLLLDISGLAAINLTHGRGYGDALLREVADLLTEMDVVEQAYHVNHNNFAAILSVETPAEAEQVYTEIGERMSGKCRFYAGAVPIKKDVFADVGQLIDSVNMTLKRAKRKGTPCVELFSMDEIRQRIESLTLLEEIRYSVEHDFEGFELVYQPQVRGGDYGLCGVEALLRYTSPSRGRIFPNEFIPLLEASRLILPVGMWALEQALLQCKAWRAVMPSLRVSVNFSSVQFEDTRIGEKVVDMLKKTGMPGSSLMVEITESVQLHQSEQLASIVKYLKAYGVGLSIDDFGTGYSNLGYLKQAEIDEVKIDRAFVSGIEAGTYNYKLISNVLEFAKANDIHVCCEGVETASELAVLEALRPDLIQGYLFDRPCSVSEIESSYLDENSEAYRHRMKNIRHISQSREQAGVVHLDSNDILHQNHIGLWIVRMDKESGNCELHVDRTFEEISGLDQKCTPRERFDFWYNRIEEQDEKLVREQLRCMMDTDKMILVDYTWKHPLMGNVMVRYSGKRVQNTEGVVVAEGYFRVINNLAGARQEGEK